MSAISRETHEYRSPAFFERALDFSRLNSELIAYAGLVLLSIITHLWALDRMAMHHDESIHAWMSWKFFTGVGSFVCAGGRTAFSYCYDPVYHGPSLYVLTLISYFLFGVGDAQARLPQAIAGIVLVGSCWMLRPLIGRRGAFIAAVVIAFAPSLLYYTRFARHDGLMLLWTFWIVVGFFRYLQTARPGFLYLFAAGVALAVATHELYYILFFLFGFFLLVRVLSELVPRRNVTIWLGVIFAMALVLEILNPQITPRLETKGLALLFMTVSGAGLLLLRAWDNRAIATARGIELWREQRTTLWVGVGILLSIYVLLYSVFFTDPRGILDGAYQGISYWLGSQQDYQRGKQPWYYYLMLLPLYEPLALFGGFAALVYLFASRSPHSGNQAPETNDFSDAESSPERELAVEGDVEAPRADAQVPDARLFADDTVRSMFPLFLAFWFIGALVAFSWAGEKMPWLLTHIALPGNLLAAWALGRLIDSVEWRNLPDRTVVALVSPLILLLVVVLGVALWRFSPNGSQGLAAQSAMLQGLIPLAVAGLVIFMLLTIGQRIGIKVTLAVTAFTLAGLTGAYMIRASWMVVYDHPDTPIEPLIYTQSTPETTRIVREIRELAISQTRNNRTANDPTGGLSMPVIMDVGDTNGDGSLAWPYQWYLRDFQRMENRNADFFRNATANSFEVQAPGQAEGTTELAPVVLVYKPHVTFETTRALEENYTKRYEAKLNWWFPEGDLTGCNPTIPGYKQFYYSSEEDARKDPDCASVDFNSVQYHNLLAPILWPFDRSHWSDTWRYLIWRQLPENMRLDGRQMEMWVRSDLMGGTSQATTSTSTVRLVAQQAIGSGGNGEGQVSEPRGAAVDAQGNLYVADTGNHRIVMFGPDGTQLRSMGSYGSGDGQLNEPRGVAVDSQGNVYVADTWNARVVKFGPNGEFLEAWGEGTQDFGSGRRATATDRTEAGNQANPLGLFGPRGIAVDTAGNVFIADTGNRRIVVTDTEGNYRYQWGYEGSQPGAFNEPIGVAVDENGSVYVADTWNGRVQVFSKTFEAENVNPTPSATILIPGWQINTYDDPYIAVGTGGKIYATVPTRNQVVYANTNGDVLLRWGGEGADFASLNYPSGLAVGPSGGVYVVDRGNGRTLRFAIPEIAPPVSGQ